MAVLGRLEVNRLREVEFLDNNTGPHVEVRADDINELIRRPAARAVRIDVQRKRLRDTNGVRELDEGAARELGLDKRFGNPSCEISCRAVHFAVVFAGESAAAVGAPATVGVNDDLAAGETSVTLWAADDEETGRLDLSVVRRVPR
jgi:hypothetical protein